MNRNHPQPSAMSKILTPYVMFSVQEAAMSVTDHSNQPLQLANKHD